jgi:hypothetical protein
MSTRQFLKFRRTQLVSNVLFHERAKLTVIEMWRNVDPEIGDRLEEKLDKMNENVDHSKAPPSQRVLAERMK